MILLCSLADFRLIRPSACMVLLNSFIHAFVGLQTQFIYSTVTESAANRDAAETVTVPVTVYADPVTEYLPTIAADPVTVYAEPITKYRTVTIKLQSEPSARYQKEPSDKYFQKLPENPVPILSTVTVTVPPRCP